MKINLKQFIKNILFYSGLISLYRMVYTSVMTYVLVPVVYCYTQRYRILSSIDSIKYIKTRRCSISRYGDGEFAIIWGGHNGFQSKNKELGIRLKDILVNKSNIKINHIIGIPYSIKDCSDMVPEAKRFWSFFSVHHFFFLKELLRKDTLYANALISRFYIDYHDVSNSEKQLNELKRLWDSENLLIVEGCETRSGIGNDLYSNAKSIKRILGPATNAFDLYDEMLDVIKHYAQKDQLVLLSYGMTATVLAYDLAQLGYWAIDIGHLDIEYEWFRMGVKTKIPIEGKFTNEIESGRVVDECNDLLYQSQIICDISRRQYEPCSAL